MVDLTDFKYKACHEIALNEVINNPELKTPESKLEQYMTIFQNLKVYCDRNSKM